MKSLVAVSILAVLIATSVVAYVNINQGPAIALQVVNSVGDPKGRQITVPVGSTVTVYTTVKAVGGYATGTLKVEIRKDIVWQPDQTHKFLTKTIELKAGETKTFNMGTFTAEDLTGDSPGQVRSYFVKVYFNDKCIYDPTDPNTREWVKTKPTGTVEYKGTEFEA
jgi:hypothetical protein